MYAYQDVINITKPKSFPQSVCSSSTRTLLCVLQQNMKYAKHQHARTLAHYVMASVLYVEVGWLPQAACG